MKKFLCMFFAVFFFIASSPMSVSALQESSMDNSMVIDTLIEDRAELICQGRYDELGEIDRQLTTLGVEFLDQQDVQQRFLDDSVAVPLADVPVSSNVTWMSTRTRWSHSGTVYEIQTLIAQAARPDSNLNLSGSRSISSTYKWGVGAMNVISAVASSAAGEIPGASVVQTVYDVVSGFITGISRTTEISSAEAVYSYSHTTTACFKYVKIDGQSDEWQELAHISTKGTTVVGCQFPTFYYEGGLTYPGVIQGSWTINSTPSGYNSHYRAVLAYIDPTSGSREWVTRVNITGIESEIVSNIYPLCPEFPMHVY